MNTYLVNQKSVSSGDYSFDALNDGKHLYCFSNENWAAGTKEVSFNVHGIVYVPESETPNDPLENEGMWSTPEFGDSLGEEFGIYSLEQVGSELGGTGKNLDWKGHADLWLVQSNNSPTFLPKSKTNNHTLWFANELTAIRQRARMEGSSGGASSNWVY